MNFWINYHHLYYFKVIASEGSIARASEKLRLGQPTLSAQLKQFEETLGVTLFERQHRKLILTDMGKIALQYANEIFSIGNEMYEVLHDRLIPNRTHIQVGALDSIPKAILNDLIDFSFKNFQCSVSILEGNADELLRELSLHKIDLLIFNYLPVERDLKTLQSKSIGRFPIGFYADKKFLNLKKKFPQSLNNAPFILPTNHSKLRHDLYQYFISEKIEVDLVAETQDTALQKLLGVSGKGIVPIATMAADKLVKAKELFEIGRTDKIKEEFFLLSIPRKVENHVASFILKNFILS